VVLVLGLAAEAKGHGARLPFDQWGGFSTGAVVCQRVIARAAAQCAAASWDARRSCRSAQLTGASCDEAATAKTISDASIRALNTIDDYCSERQAIELQYLGSFDLQADVTKFCRAWTTAAESAVYRPFGGSSAISPAQRQCADAAANAADDVMQSTFRHRRQCMDRIASTSLQDPNRTALLDSATQRMDAAHDAAVTRLSARCGAAAFATLYGRTPDVFVAGLAQRADCIGGQFYIQNAVLCPAPVCGNGILEQPGDPLFTDEDCDDGNTMDGDGCPSTCRLP
jgi:cysteine-rich repeat protein